MRDSVVHASNKHLRARMIPYHRRHLRSSEMPPKSAFTLERVQAFGVVAAEDARTRLANDGGPACVQLTCEYRGVAVDDGAYDINKTPTRRSTIAYQWHATACGQHEQLLVTVRCDNASGQGVPFPQTWQTALRCSSLQTIADDAAKAAREEIGGEIACTLLGVAKTTDEGGEYQPGATMLSAGDGSRMAHILCARVSGDTWLCHRGSFEDGALNEPDPLNEHDLVVCRKC